nr:hypothetical protein [uncultured Methanobrevibacter sp.]
MDLSRINLLNILAVVQRIPLIKRYIDTSKNNDNYKKSVEDSSRTTLDIDEDLKRRLEARSKKTGFSEHDLVNSYIFHGLNEDEKYECEGGMTPEEIFELLEHDLPEGDWVSNELMGLIETEYLTNAVKLKKDSYK